MRAFNFCAGPAALPTAVLERAREELLDWRGAGCSVMEISHRNPLYMEVAGKAEQDLRTLLSIPEHYAVLFLSGGATTQFSMVPFNLARQDAPADYIDTGHWSAKAIREGARYTRARVVASAREDGYRSVPECPREAFDEGAAYVHYCPNETIHGVAFPFIPETGDVPLVADYSSAILSGPLDVSRFGVIYAGAQKNIGPAGITVVIVRRDLIGRARPDTPALYDYALHAGQGSMANTPPTYPWYLAGLVFEWLLEQGGLPAIEAVNARKAEKLYACIDGSDFYRNPVRPDCRSRMNVPFTLADDRLDNAFLEESAASGLLFLKGHRAVGGMRASLYNAVPEEAVDALVAFLQEFERTRG